MPDIEPDEVANYEVGAKGLAWDNRLQFDIAVYYLEWTDVQQTIQVQNPFVAPGEGFFITTINGENASGSGLDLGLTLLPTDDLKLDLTFGWNDLTFDEAVVGDAGTLFESDDRLNAAPEYTGSVGVEYSFLLGDYQGFLSGTASYSSGIEVHRGVDNIDYGDDMFDLRLSLAVESGDHWRTTLFVNNATNEDSIRVSRNGRPTWTVRERPRTVGLQLEYTF